MEMVVSGAKRMRTLEEEEAHHEDRISFLPDGVLGDIVSFLPTKDGARTQVLSSRWRHQWRSSPLHPALDGLQELEFHHASHPYWPPPSLPASVHRFSSTLRVASFGFPDGDGGGATGRLHLPVLQQLSLTDVRISERSLRALLAACPVLQSLLLDGGIGYSHVEIALRSVGMCSGIGLQQLVIQDTPCLERLLLDSLDNYGSNEITVSVVSAPKLHALGPLSAHGIKFGFDTTIFQGPRSVKVLALIQVDLSLDAVIESMKCFPCLEKLYIKTKMAGEKNTWCRKYKDLIRSLHIRLKKIVLAEYRGNASHANFAKFFVLNARMLKCMRLELYCRDPSSAWIDKQHRLLQIKNKASRDMQKAMAEEVCRMFELFSGPEIIHMAFRSHNSKKVFYAPED